MKYLILLLLPLSVFGQDHGEINLVDRNEFDMSRYLPPDTVELRTVINNDTIFIYREAKKAHNCLRAGCSQREEIYHDRQVFIARQNKIVFLRNEPAKYRTKEVIEKKIISEEYW